MCSENADELSFYIGKLQDLTFNLFYVKPQNTLIKLEFGLYCPLKTTGNLELQTEIILRLSSALQS